MKIYPSLISSDILNLRNVVKMLDPHCDGYHIDIMDDHFVPNLTWGPAFVNALRKTTELPLDVHLMVDNPEEWVSRLELKKDDFFVFHIEAVKDCLKIIKEVKKIGCKVGIALNPATPAEQIFPFLSELDQVLIMSVNPGFSGQKFIPEVLKKADLLIKKRDLENLSFLVSMDGGIGLSNIMEVADVGVDMVGAASAIFKKDDYVAAIQELYNQAR